MNVRLILSLVLLGATVSSIASAQTFSNEERALCAGQCSSTPAYTVEVPEGEPLFGVTDNGELVVSIYGTDDFVYRTAIPIRNGQCVRRYYDTFRNAWITGLFTRASICTNDSLSAQWLTSAADTHAINIDNLDGLINVAWFQEHAADDALELTWYRESTTLTVQPAQGQNTRVSAGSAGRRSSLASGYTPPQVSCGSCTDYRNAFPPSQFSFALSRVDRSSVSFIEGPIPTVEADVVADADTVSPEPTDDGPDLDLLLDAYASTAELEEEVQDRCNRAAAGETIPCFTFELDNFRANTNQMREFVEGALDTSGDTDESLRTRFDEITEQVETMRAEEESSLELDRRVGRR